ncbi:MAG: HIT family protein [Nanoarchaeota archaeon]
MDCIFCKIVAGKIPCQKVFEDKAVLAFLDINPIHKGHTLVIPKKHYDHFMQMPAEEAGALFSRVHELAPAVMKAVSADGLNVGLNNYAAAGQAVFHTHVHLIPRYLGDGLSMWPSGEYGDGEMPLFREKIVGTLKRK